MNSSAYWIAAGDLHDDAAPLARIAELAGAQGLVLTGDLTFTGGTRAAERVVEFALRHTPRILAQIGNMDKEEVTEYLEGRGMNLHRKAKELFPGVFAVGVGASPPTPFNTPTEYSEERIGEYLEEAYGEFARLAARSESTRTPRLVLVSHAPPFETACDKLRNGISVGSRAVRAFIENRRPDVCVCGHIHEARAEDYIGNTHVLNPGDLAGGGYVVLHAPEGEGPVRACMAKIRK